jgi:hypothetical protein
MKTIYKIFKIIIFRVEAEDKTVSINNNKCTKFSKLKLKLVLIPILIN